MISLWQEQLAGELAVMDRQNLIGMLSSLDCGFQFDFTKEFLDSVSLERLRHIVLAASLQARSK